MKTFYNWLENQEPNDIKSEIMNDPIPDNLKNLYRAVFRYNRNNPPLAVQTLNKNMAKYDNMKLPMLDAHGLTKVNLSFQLNSLIRLLKAGKMPESMYSAPLTSSSENAGVGAGHGTGGGSAYRDGSFIVVAPPGKMLHDEIKYIIVDGSVADANFNENGMTPTQLLQKELGQGRYIFIDGGDENNQLDKFFSQMQQYNQKTNANTEERTPNTNQKDNIPEWLEKNFGIQPKDVEITEYPEKKLIGFRNRKKGSPGYGSMTYYDKSKPNQYGEFITQLKASFGF